MGSPLPHTANPPIALSWPSPAFSTEIRKISTKQKTRAQEGTPFAEQAEHVKQERLDNEDTSYHQVLYDR